MSSSPGLPFINHQLVPLEIQLVELLNDVRSLKKQTYTTPMYPLGHMIMESLRMLHSSLIFDNVQITTSYCHMDVKFGKYYAYVALEKLDSEENYSFTFGKIDRRYSSHAELCTDMVAFLAHGFSQNGFYDLIHAKACKK
jgi:hypothetical protein